MNFIKALALATVVVAPCVNAQDQASVLHDFKGVSLGTTLTDFRKMPHPDGKNAYVVCTGQTVAVSQGSPRRFEPMVVKITDDSEKALGVKRCIWLDPDKMALGSSTPLSLGNSGLAAHTYSFSFVVDPSDGMLRMYQYSGSASKSAFEGTVRALTEKWGEPVLGKGRIWQSPYFVDSETAVWDRELSSIAVESPTRGYEPMTIIMRHKALSKIVADAKAADKNRPRPNAI